MRAEGVVAALVVVVVVVVVVVAVTPALPCAELLIAKLPCAPVMAGAVTAAPLCAPLPCNHAGTAAGVAATNPPMPTPYPDA